MTRDEIRKLFPEATDEQVSTLLSSHHNELNKLKDDNKALKEKADKFDAAERDKLSQEESLNLSNLKRKVQKSVASSRVKCTSAK